VLTSCVAAKFQSLFQISYVVFTSYHYWINVTESIFNHLFVLIHRYILGKRCTLRKSEIAQAEIVFVDSIIGRDGKYPRPYGLQNECLDNNVN